MKARPPFLNLLTFDPRTQGADSEQKRVIVVGDTALVEEMFAGVHWDDGLCRVIVLLKDGKGIPTSLSDHDAYCRWIGQNVAFESEEKTPGPITIADKLDNPTGL